MSQPDGPARVQAILHESVAVKQALAESGAEAVARAAELCTASLQDGGKILLFGNGGSASDAQHIAGELTGRLSRERPALPAIALQLAWTLVLFGAVRVMWSAGLRRYGAFGA